ncbi:hypothetical protein NUU61_004594 [Penicillium alfredii]|uniref:Zn(2)-C6 fungal-type domain-containing protein n=1 Tax=Penicillium alfredii TaxID=1506179 RepID=A0A9W9FLH6_9EURO|nr:uncharacterized protein NUU61_004594 [Penicillium alfredii]KAJ5102372.1 hypothetical protein NUU61_004594 [Penicillium alfredii]
MQSLVLHPPSLSSPFGQPRFNSGPERLPLNRPRSTNARGYSPRAALPHQSMSRSPLAEEPSETSAESKPRGYPLSSVVTTAEEVTATVPELPPLPPPVSEPIPARLPPGYSEQATPVFPGSPRLPPGAPPYPLPALEGSASGPAHRSFAHKSTRRTKAHVASACVNCKKKHLGCDPARPCRRCVLSGKASSCVDVTHKKRGRPPLKAEDSSLRSYTTHLDHPAVPAEAQPPVLTRPSTMHRATSSRELRPMTDLQRLGDAGQAAAGMPMQHRLSASVFPLTRPMDASPSIPGPVGRRSFSSSGPPYSAPAGPPPAFVPMPVAFNPVLKAGSMPSSMERRFSAYAAPSLPPPTSPPQHHPVNVPFLPYTEPPGSIIRPPLSDPRLPAGPPEPYRESPVRLPPIHQATASPGPPHLAHRLSDPYPATWSFPTREEGPPDPRRPAALHRPVGPIFSPSFSHQRSSSAVGPVDPKPRHLGPIDLFPPLAPANLSPREARAEQPTSEAEPQEPRPVKRRKMALDDMVNG